MEALLARLQRAEDEARQARMEAKAAAAKQVETDALLAKLLSERDGAKARGKRKEGEYDRDDQDSGRSQSRRVDATEGYHRVMKERDSMSRRGYKSMTPAELALEAARGISRSPFTNEILDAPEPEKWRLRDLPVYSGTTDPLEHIFKFHQKLRSKDDATQCLAFPSSLEGGALTWFRSLPEGTVDSFLLL